MGNKSAKSKVTQEEKKTSDAIDRKAREEQRKNIAINKLLLLGAGESGKSTMFKQMISMYGNGLSEENLRTLGPVIHSNVIAWLQRLINGIKVLDGPKLNPEYEKYAEKLLTYKGNDELHPDDSDLLKQLWEDPAIQHVWENKSRFQVGESLAYFMDKIDEVCSPDYVPNHDDALRARAKTSGIVETDFSIMNSKFKMIDVGGQRSERRKWIQCFDDVTGVIFVAALSEYDQLCSEDEETNRFDEALMLFEQTCGNKYLSNTAMILFLNKKDLFAEKIKRVPFTSYKPEFQGNANDYDEVVEAVKKIFLDCNKNPNRTVYIHVTCATDSNNVATVFAIVKDIVIKATLESGSLL